MSDLPGGSAPPPYKNADSAPFVYFDIAPVFGTMAGAIQIELASRILSPTDDRKIATEFVTTGRLRCSPAAARELREAIDKSLELLAQSQEAPVVAGKLN
jgi:hypothetical protein